MDEKMIINGDNNVVGLGNQVNNKKMFIHFIRVWHNGNQTNFNHAGQVDKSITDLHPNVSLGKNSKNISDLITELGFSGVIKYDVFYGW